ncbi:4-methyl-5(b-hydroxyethyl)-thiazole monophosphate biosynthesis [Dethiosulfatibacter aminovorans DSM 17477]|uniref:4-methyl-5(B-hydroxyethyl)-thiazole monophosphate biosynthesis n=1 Tax=Dethiosulfatibacter aminovorans DSM 17477 TaxID=1121476 RepID=A0A1M6GQN6_9FIRM|nr:DJ-1 family glyoxalase III [Dethiosulfatibacter aminovorans]SHJ12255.1 4-methyl-5(b-hydroxyethyl)-thiazole monophosphate biosynthesis [Dethiosulfatibacter aminovorans DSM 17477]
MKIAVLAKNGFEELEMMGIVDMARRMDVKCHIIGCDDDYVTGSHHVKIEADLRFEEMDDDYDAIVLPGGPGAYDLRNDNRIIDIVRKYIDRNKVVAAICAAPIVLEKAGVIKGKKVTSYPTVSHELKSANYERSVVQTDGNIVTGNGPAATFSFAFAVLEALGLDTGKLREATQFEFLLGKSS